MHPPIGGGRPNYHVPEGGIPNYLVPEGVDRPGGGGPNLTPYQGVYFFNVLECLKNGHIMHIRECSAKKRRGY